MLNKKLVEKIKNKGGYIVNPKSKFLLKEFILIESPKFGEKLGLAIMDGRYFSIDLSFDNNEKMYLVFLPKEKE